MKNTNLKKYKKFNNINIKMKNTCMKLLKN